jgi:hypothetical protein
MAGSDVPVQTASENRLDAVLLESAMAMKRTFGWSVAMITKLGANKRSGRSSAFIGGSDHFRMTGSQTDIRGSSRLFQA